MRKPIQTWYELTAGNGKAFPPLESEAAADVVIIGGGLTGIAAGYKLAKAGSSVILLEPSTISYGATGRSGGHLTAGFNCQLEDLADVVGNGSAVDLWKMTVDGRRAIYDLVKEHNINCSLSRGVVHVARTQKQERLLLETAGKVSLWLNEDPMEILRAPELERHVASDSYAFGISYPRAATFHPTRFLYALAALAEEAGLKIHEHSAVANINTERQTSVTLTSGHHVRASKIIICGTAFMNGVLLPNKARTVSVPVYQIISKPLDSHVAQGLLPMNDALIEAGYMPDTLHIDNENRLLMGGNGRLFNRGGPSLTEAVRKKWEKTFPQLHQIEIEYVWNHYMGIPMNFMPVFENVQENIFMVHGLSGHGLVNMYLAGEILAEAALGNKERYEAFARIKQLRLPQRAHHSIAKMGLLYYRLRDMMLSKER